MLAWLKNNWLNLLSLVATIILGLLHYLLEWPIIIIIIIGIIIFSCIGVFTYEKFKKGKIENELLKILNLPEPNICCNNYKKKDLEIMRNLLMEKAISTDSLDTQKKAIFLLSQINVRVKETMSFLLGLAKDQLKGVDIRCAAVNALGRISSDDVIEYLSIMLEDQNSRIVEAAASGLREKRWGSKVLWALLRLLFKNNKPSFKRQIMATIVTYCEEMPSVEPELLEIMKCLVDYGNDQVVIDSALEVIKKAGWKPAASILSDLQKRWEGFPQSEAYAKIKQTLSELGERGL